MRPLYVLALLALLALLVLCAGLAGCQSMPAPVSVTVDTPALQPAPPKPASTLGAPLAPEWVDTDKPPRAAGLAGAKPVTKPMRQASQLERDQAPDLWARLRLGFALEPTSNADVQRMAQRYAKSRLLDATQDRAKLYLYDLLVQAEALGLPTELALLPYVESALNVQAKSHAGAVGLCQFMPATGKRFNLPQSLFVDARRDARRCGIAMYSYLAENHRRFGDWALALAAYNAGEGAVEKAIARNKRQGLPTHFSALAAALALPQETRNYVPALLGLVAVITQPESFGVKLPFLPNVPGLRSVPVPADVDVHLLASMAGISEAALRSYNPALNNIPLLPRAAQPQVSLPEAAAQRLEQAFEAAAKTTHKLASWTTKTITQPTRIDALAKLHHVPADVLRSVNQMPIRHAVVQAGSTLLIPKSQGNKIYADISAVLIQDAVLVTRAEPKRRKVKPRLKTAYNMQFEY